MTLAIPGSQVAPPVPADMAHTALARMFVLAVWMKLPADNPEQLYQHQMSICFPDGTEKIVANDETVCFPYDDKPLNRYAFVVNGTPSTMPGILRFESRMRRIGDEEWIRQDYPIVFVVRSAVPPEQQPPTA